MTRVRTVADRTGPNDTGAGQSNVESGSIVHLRNVWKEIRKADFRNYPNRRTNAQLLCLSTMYDQSARFINKKGK